MSFNELANRNVNGNQAVALARHGLVLFEETDPERLSTQWQQLLEENGMPFQSLEWTDAWVESHKAEMEVRKVVIVGKESSGKIHFIFPFVVRRRFSLRQLEFAGSSHGTYSGALFSSQFESWADADLMASIFAGISTLLPELDLITLSGFPKSMEQGINPLGHIVKKTPNISSYRLVLRSDWEALYANKFSAKTRSKHRNSERRLTKAGEVRHIIAKTSEQKQRLLKQLLSTKSADLKTKGLPDPFGGQEIQSFYERLLAIDLDKTNIDVSLAAIELDGEPIAISFDIVHRKIWYGLITVTSSSEYQRYSPGSYLLRENIKHCCESKIRIFDFGVGDGVYKNRWSEIEITRNDAAIPYTLRGKAFLTVARVHWAIRNTVKSNPRLRGAAMSLKKYLNGRR